MKIESGLETELRRVRPATPPDRLMERLRRAEPAGSATPQCARSQVSAAERILAFFRWVVPVTAMLVLSLVLWRAYERGVNTASSQNRSEPAIAPRKSDLKADDVKIDRELVSSFDAIARLPGGEPVRFECTEWMDEVVWRDKANGVTVQKRTPRLEVVPVRFETY